MPVAHQSLKELAQRPDEEVVQLWLEQRGLSTPTTKPTCTPLPNSGFASPNHDIELQQHIKSATLNKYDIILEEFPKLQLQIVVLRRLSERQVQNQGAHWCELNSIKEELLKVSIRLEQIEFHLSRLVSERMKNIFG